MNVCVTMANLFVDAVETCTGPNLLYLLLEKKQMEDTSIQGMGKRRKGSRNLTGMYLQNKVLPPCLHSYSVHCTSFYPCAEFQCHHFTHSHILSLSLPPPPLHPSPCPSPIDPETLRLFAQNLITLDIGDQLLTVVNEAESYARERVYKAEEELEGECMFH